MLPIIGAAYVLVGAAYEVIGAAVVTGAETEVCTCAVMEPVATGAAVTSQQSDRCATLASHQRALLRKPVRPHLTKTPTANFQSRNLLHQQTTTQYVGTLS